MSGIGTSKFQTIFMDINMDRNDKRPTHKLKWLFDYVHYLMSYHYFLISFISLNCYNFIFYTVAIAKKNVMKILLDQR